MIERKIGRSACAIAIAASIILGGSSCKKNTKEEKRRTILETDPFFTSEMHELNIPVDTEREVGFLTVMSAEIFGDEVVVSYEIDYALPEGVGDGGYFPADYDYNDYFQNWTATFDLDGNLLRSENLAEEGGLHQCYTTDKEGRSVCLMEKESPETGEAQDVVVFQNKEGKIEKEVVLESQWDTLINKIRILEDGRILVQQYESPGAHMYVFDSNGKYQFKITSPDRGVEGDLFMQDGKYYAITSSFDPDESFDFMLNEIDMTTGEIKPGKVMDSVDGLMLMQAVFAEDGLYSSTANGLVKYDIASGKMVEVINWNQTDLNRTLLDSVRCYPKNQDEYRAIVYDYSDIKYEKLSLLTLKRVEKNPHAGQKILYVGGLGIPSNFYDYAYEYNADLSHDLRIETVDYSFANEETDDTGMTDYSGLVDSIYLKLLSGDGPDILLNFDKFSQFENSDLFVDLNPYIDGKNGLERSEYFDSIFRANEKNGRLFHAPITFNLVGLMVNSERMDVNRNWNLDDFDRAVSALPSDVSLVPQPICGMLLSWFMGADVSEYVDYDKRQTHFQSESMVRALEVAGKYGSAIESPAYTYIGSSIYMKPGFESVVGLTLEDDSPEEGMESINAGAMLYTGQCAMYGIDLSSMDDYCFYHGVVGGCGRYVGYPTSGGNGVAASANMSLAILSSSKYQDESWEIIKSFYSEEAQIKMCEQSQYVGSGFPMRRSVFEKTSRETVDRVNNTYDCYLQDLNKGNDAGSCIYFQADEAMVDEVREIIESVRISGHYDSAVMSIIDEETAGYFQDSRSAEDVLKTIDNRARQIIAER
ncbi:MAG: extracellular solute-binding protein [Clostridiales bacterium]|nr:extracellular solute-binding protein [Clostridiales bacterium]